MTTTAMTGSIFIRVGDNPAQEVATFGVPVVATMTYASAEATLEVGDIRSNIASALRRAADELEANR